MKRRNLITNVAIAATSTAALASRSQASESEKPAANSKSRIRWKMATSWPKSLDTLFGGAETICDRVREMTGGRFSITPYAAGEIVPGLQVMDAVQAGTVECGHSPSYYYIGKNPALVFGTSVPFGLTAGQQNAWLYHGGGMEAMNKIYADFNIISFPAGNTGAQMGGWFKREIDTVADLEGLKMRIPGLGGQVMAKLGVNVQVLAGGEVYLALERGAIDAAEWAGPYDDEKLGLNKAAQYYYYPGWWEPGPTLFAQVNLNAWNKLSQEDREIFQTAAYEANINMLAKYDALNAKALTKLIGNGTQLRAYSPEIMKAAKEASFELYEENASRDASFKAVYQQWQEFRKLVFNWNQVNQLSFARFAFNNK